MEDDQRIKSLVETWGADFYGVADLALAREAILAQGGPAMEAFAWALLAGLLTWITG